MTPFSRKKILLLILSVAGVLLLLFSYTWFSYQNNKKLKVIFFDVGQGDSALIRTPVGQNILIDGGPDLTVMGKLGKYLPFYDKTIDLMVLTHPHADHVTGLVEVLRRYQVEQVLATGVAHTTPDYLAWLQLVKEKNIKFIRADQEKSFVFENNNSQNKIALKILYPFDDISQKDFADLNDSSIVFKLSFGKNNFLFMGDLPSVGEQELLKHDIDLQAEVLKTGHHGSKYSSSLEFLSAVSPELAIISDGKKNSFGHPHYRALKNLEKFDIKILRTDQVGDIILQSDGEKVIVGN